MSGKVVDINKRREQPSLQQRASPARMAIPDQAHERAPSTNGFHESLNGFDTPDADRPSSSASNKQTRLLRELAFEGEGAHWRAPSHRRDRSRGNASPTKSSSQPPTPATPIAPTQSPLRKGSTTQAPKLAISQDPPKPQVGPSNGEQPVRRKQPNQYTDPSLLKHPKKDHQQKAQNRTSSVSYTPTTNMSAAQKKGQRIKNKKISRRFIIGNESRVITDEDRRKNPSIPEGHVYKWRLYLRNVEGGPDLSVWLDKVLFKIHDDYKPNNNRVIENQPFEIEETGYGGFMIDIKLHFKPVVGERPTWRHLCHFLQLEPFGTEAEKADQISNGKHVVSETMEIIEFNEPHVDLWDALTSENQWDYMDRAASRGRGKGKGNPPPKAFGPGQTAKDEFGTERTVELRERGVKGDMYSKEMQTELLDLIKRAGEEVDRELDKVMKKREEVEKELKEAKENGELIKK